MSVLKNMHILLSLVAFRLLSVLNIFLTVPKSCLISGPSLWIYSPTVNFLLLKRHTHAHTHTHIVGFICKKDDRLRFFPTDYIKSKISPAYTGQGSSIRYLVVVTEIWLCLSSQTKTTHVSETAYMSIFRCNGGKGEVAVVGPLESASINLNTVHRTLHSLTL